MLADEKLAAYLDGEMELGEQTAFEAELLADEASRLELLAQRKLSSGLRALLANDHARLEQAIITSTRGLSNEALARRVVTFRSTGLREERPRRSVAWWMPLAAAATIAVGLFWAGRALFQHPTTSVTAAPSAIIAVLARASDAVWAEANAARQAGQTLRPGWLRLKSGAVQVEFSRGAHVVLEGPAEFQLVSDNEGVLRTGKLWARVPEPAHGFTIRATEFTVVDRGTEFGCKVTEAGPSEVHVFAGSVELRTRDTTTGSLALLENHAVQLVNGIAQEIPARREAFLSEERLAQPVAVVRARWIDQDIGGPGHSGYSHFDRTTGIWTVAGGGADIFGASDQFHFVSQDFMGDGTIIARVNGVQRTDKYAKAGVMLRDSTSANAMFAYAFIGPETVGFEWRNATGSAAIGAWIGGGADAPRWLKLVRRGNNFSGYCSADGVVWTQLGSAQSIPISATAKAGLAVTAHNDSALNSSTFSNVSLLPAGKVK